MNFMLIWGVFFPNFFVVVSTQKRIETIFLPDEMDSLFPFTFRGKIRNKNTFSWLENIFEARRLNYILWKEVVRR